MKKLCKKIKFSIGILIITAVVTFVTISCSHYKWAVRNKDYICKELCTVNIDTVVNYKDTTVIFNIDTIVNMDTISGTFIIECDSLRNAYIKLLDSKGKITYVFKDKILKVYAMPEPLRLHFQKIVTLTQKIKQITTAKLQPYEVTRYRVPFWAWLIIGALIALLIVQYLKRFRL